MYATLFKAQTLTNKAFRSQKNKFCASNPKGFVKIHLGESLTHNEMKMQACETNSDCLRRLLITWYHSTAGPLSFNTLDTCPNGMVRYGIAEFNVPLDTV